MLHFQRHHQALHWFRWQLWGNIWPVHHHCTELEHFEHQTATRKEEKRKEKKRKKLHQKRKKVSTIYSTPPHSLLSKNEKSKQQKYNLITKHLCKTYLHVGNGNNRIRERRKKTVTPKPSVLNGGPLGHGVV